MSQSTDKAASGQEEWGKLFMYPPAYMYDPVLRRNGNALVLVCHYFRRRDWATNQVPTGYSRSQSIDQELGMSKQRQNEARKLLVELGLITIEKVGRQNVITLIPRKVTESVTFEGNGKRYHSGTKVTESVTQRSRKALPLVTESVTFPYTNDARAQTLSPNPSPNQEQPPSMKLTDDTPLNKVPIMSVVSLVLAATKLASAHYWVTRTWECKEEDITTDVTRGIAETWRNMKQMRTWGEFRKAVELAQPEHMSPGYFLNEVDKIMAERPTVRTSPDEHWIGWERNARDQEMTVKQLLTAECKFDKIIEYEAWKAAR